jgi:hypothetical protein
VHRDRAAAHELASWERLARGLSVGRELIYLALQNAVRQWTRTRNWTIALLAFKIHFGDRLPDAAN